MAIVTRSSTPNEAKAADNRGKRAEASVGEVKGSGADAGGGGNPEDYDSDPQGGGGALPPGSPPPEGGGADAPSHGTR